MSKKSKKQTNKIEDGFKIPDKKGNGQIKIQYLSDDEGNVLTYSMAYINSKIFSGDNGRVVGYDNAHGYHHRHYMGKIEPVEYVSLEDTMSKFQADWHLYLKKRSAK